MYFFKLSHILYPEIQFNLSAVKAEIVNQMEVLVSEWNNCAIKLQMRAAKWLGNCQRQRRKTFAMLYHFPVALSRVSLFLAGRVHLILGSWLSFPV